MTRVLYLSTLLMLVTIAAYGQKFDGYALYNNSNDRTTFLIDENGDIAHSWSLPTACNYTVQLMDNGHLMRGAVRSNNAINGAAVGGLVQEFDQNGDLVWEFEYSTADYVSHHDICLMPGGNVLLTAWEVKQTEDLEPVGYTGTSALRYPTHFIEVAQDGTGGKIVWEWHIWDHMIQDVDSLKPNYGVISEHPELMDINVPSSSRGGPGGRDGDWFHVNGIDYNDSLDQIVFSSRFMSEIFIIDHSTTTEEAAGHTGGNAGKGGDFLFRWGNPDNYGVTGSRNISGPVHDPRWIPNDGRPRGGYIQFFNNEGTGSRSTADAIELPFASDGYNYERMDGQPYGPEEPSWRHICLDNASGQSASTSLPNGNTFVNLSRGYMYEVDQEDNLVWQYNAGPPKGFRYTCDHPGIQSLIQNGIIDDQCTPVAVHDLNSTYFQVVPNPSTGLFQIKGLTADQTIQNFEVLDMLGKRVQAGNSTTRIDLSAQADGLYFLSVQLDKELFVTQKILLAR